MKSRVVILGLDSATFEVIDDLISAGRLPNFSKVCCEGVCAKMISTYPPRTAPAWVTIMTGQNPGNHGIFDFWFRKVDGYDSVITSLITSANYAGKTIFDVLSKNGKRVAALFIPMTFPTWRINGEMIAGPPLVPRSDEGLSFPPGIHKKVGVEHHVHLFPPSIRKGINRNKTVNDLLRMEESRAQVALDLWDGENYDCLMFVLEAIDIVQHHLWRYFRSENPGDFKDTIPKFYEKADEIIGELMRRLERDDVLFVVSDHGMTGHPETCFNTNAWLASKGWLAVSKRKASLTRLMRLSRNLLHGILPEEFYGELKKRFKTSRRGVAKGIRMSDQSSLAIEWGHTIAYRVQMQDPPLDGIMVNVRGRQPRGIVAEDHKAKMEAMIKNELLKVKDPSKDKTIIKAVFKRNELYSGPNACKMPDLIVEFEDGYKADSGLLTEIFSPTPAVELSRLSGTHSSLGIFMAYGSPFVVGAKLEPINISDFAPTVLYTMDQTVPASIDGKVRLECFREEFINQHELEIGEVQMDRVHDQTDYTNEDRSQVEEQLRNLGYL